MSKISQIEAELKTMEQGVFQKLCDAFLFMKYKRPPKSEGGAKGTDKTIVGTPDSFIILPNGNYIFIEYTTQQTGVGKKFLDDLVKDFDEKETGVPISKIETICLCYNSQLSPDKTNKIIEFCSSKSTDVEFIDLDTLKHEIYNYPKLAKDFLNVETDTEQILRPADFVVELENKGTSQTNVFFGREDELKELTDLLELNSITILTGKPGIGKTRIAREAAEEFIKNNEDYELFCIYNKGQPIYHDLKAYFIRGRKYIVIVDDANRIGDFPSIARLARSENCEVKLIVTVRDYVFEKVKKHLEAENYSYSVLELNLLEDDDIKKILKSLKVTNPYCVNKITKIADGNPRLVIMSADHALVDDDCSKLDDVTDIYDKFFEPLISGGELEDKTLLSVLGVICFFRVVDKHNEKLINRIYESFGIGENEFWECVFKLHSLEFVNLYEKNVVKIADQVLANYFFYLVFIKKGILDFSILLNDYLPDLSGKIIESLYPILEHFKAKEILKVLSPKIDKKYFEIKSNKERLLNFFEVFGFCKIEELLLFIQHEIEQLPDGDPEPYEFRQEGTVNWWHLDLDYPFLKPLKTFGHHPNDNFQISLELLFQYIIKAPAILPAVIRYFEEELIFDEEDHRYGYWIQTELFDFLYKKIDEGDNDELFVGALFEIAPKFLKTQFQRSKGGRKKATISIYKLMIQNTPDIEKLRKGIFEKIFSLNKVHQDKVLTFLEEYGTTWEQHPQKELYEYDIQFIIYFIQNNLSPEDFRHCQVVHAYVNRLESLKVSLPQGEMLIAQFNNKKFKLNGILEINYSDWDEIDKKSEGENFDDYNQKRLADYFSDCRLEDYFNLIEDIEDLVKLNRKGDNTIYLSLEIILLNLLDKSPEDCLAVVKHLFKINNPYHFYSGKTITRLLENFSEDKIYEVITSYEFNGKTTWLFQFFMNLKQDQVTSFYKDRLLEIYSSFEGRQYLFFDYLNNYKVIEPRIFTKVFTILLKKVKEEGLILNFRVPAFFKDHYSEFDNDLPLLKKIYLYCYIDHHYSFDRDGNHFSGLYQRDNDFLFEFLQEVLKDKHMISREDFKFAFHFVWNYESAEEIITKIIEFTEGKVIWSMGDDLVSKFFPSNDLSPRIDSFLIDYIQQNSSDKAKMNIVFKVICMCYPDSRVKYLQELLLHNTDLDLWTYLPIDKGNSFMIARSHIPSHELKIEFWESLLPIFSGKVEYLKLKQLVQSKIKSLKNKIEAELKRNFINDY